MFLCRFYQKIGFLRDIHYWLSKQFSWSHLAELELFPDHKDFCTKLDYSCKREGWNCDFEKYLRYQSTSWSMKAFLVLDGVYPRHQRQSLCMQQCLFSGKWAQLWCPWWLRRSFWLYWVSWSRLCLCRLWSSLTLLTKVLIPQSLNLKQFTKSLLNLDLYCAVTPLYSK